MKNRPVEYEEKSAKPKIKSAAELRDFALETLQQLRDGVIDVQQALTVGKLVDTVVNVVRVEIDYSKVSGEKPQINFMGKSDGTVLLDAEPETKRLGRD